jgi:hypothetical protein
MGGLVGIVVALTTVAAIGGTLFIVIRVIGGISKKQEAVRQLLATGQPATGRVLGLGTTGTSMAVMGHRHLDVVLTLEVHLPGRPPYTVQTTQMISELRLPSVQPGAQVHLRVDPMNPNRVAVADGVAPSMGGGPTAPGAPMTPGSPGAGGAWAGPPGAPAAAAWSGAPVGAPAMGAMGAMGAPAMMGAPGGGFVAPDMGQAMKKGLLSPLWLFVFFITTVPITVIMLATFVDWSAFASEEDGAPEGGYCAALVRCCKVVAGGTPAASNCDNWANLPAAGCKDAYAGYQQSAKAQGKTCE